MKNITFSADERLIEAARERARREGTTLNEEFRRWLSEYSCDPRDVREAMEIIDHIGSYARIGDRRPTRDEMNER